MRRAHKTWPAVEYFARKTSAPPALASGNAPSVTLPEKVPVTYTFPALSVATALTWSEPAPPIDRAQVLGPTVVTVTFMTSLAVAPLLSVTVSVTANVPAVAKLCDGAAVDAVVPSPKFQLYAAIVPSGSEDPALGERDDRADRRRLIGTGIRDRGQIRSGADGDERSVLRGGAFVVGDGQRRRKRAGRRVGVRRADGVRGRRSVAERPPVGRDRTVDIEAVGTVERHRCSGGRGQVGTGIGERRAVRDRHGGGVLRSGTLIIGHGERHRVGAGRCVGVGRRRAVRRCSLVAERPDVAGDGAVGIGRGRTVERHDVERLRVLVRPGVCGRCGVRARRRGDCNGGRPRRLIAGIVEGRHLIRVARRAEEPAVGRRRRGHALHERAVAPDVVPGNARTAGVGRRGPREVHGRTR